MGDQEMTICILDNHGEVKPFAEIEAEVLALVIQHKRGRLTAVARALKIDRSTLYRKIARPPKMHIGAPA